MDTLSLDLSLGLRSFDLELSLDVGDETVAIVGPSGAGKTTLLRALAGLARPDRGRIALGDEVWFDERTNVPPEERDVGFVFQDYALFPHLSVRSNVAFGGGNGTVDALLERFGLAALANERPRSLSGGERQRVALARALARGPRLLLLDEPLAALDAHTKSRVRVELRGHLRGAGLPTLLVTHDYDDAAALADRVGVLNEGTLVQLGTPTELIAAPASPFVAEFTGANLLVGWARRTADGLTEVELDGGQLLVSVDEAEGRVGAVVHPWEISLARERPADSMQNHVAGTVESVVPVGNRLRVRVGPITAEITERAADSLALREGDRVYASFKATGARLVSL
jgi:ABC-type sulfate/molybdate transport systems ATPase subunit